ncbi:sugar ABC transporter ATP-binding protein [Endozoicomonas sp. OPT23]|uniref:sugar ABC transporter ATP-binding protein n=1 Tax=Endozoicomonas sp. OPT23 TaxID=2072845 RepID=UPI00129BC131|nr:sugar ABC transporter ATP-binding protein [Endozoicomonas sp. OPT23]MRI31667.1 sugar ABC transporter ATP-binding protein [Endozoicomonas sp. OPT23]
MSDVEILAVTGLSKSFPGVKALNDVSLSLREGEVHALMGGNGAGKSTLIKCLTGFYSSDSGKVFLAGKDISSLKPDQIQTCGISTVHQEVNLIPTLSVAENIFLGRQPKIRGRIDWKTMNSKARAVLARLNLDIDVTQMLSSYSIAIQQMVAIARGVDMSARVLILDEPTSSLDLKEVEQLFSVMRRLTAEGTAIVFVTHFLDQVYAISNRISVLRNGHYIGTYEKADLPQNALISKMLGKTISDKTDSSTKKQSQDQDEKEVYLTASGIGKSGYIEPIDLKVHQGEVIGLAGLLGSGRSEIAKLLFGVVQPDTGRLYVQGTEQLFSSPRKAIQQGLAFCPEDRKKEGLIGELSVKENIILALQAKRGWYRALTGVQQEKIAKDFIKSLKIVTSDLNKPVKELSGGNQQKVVLARWLASAPSFLILDEPTRGVDIGAHQEIVRIIKGLSKQGLAIMVIASELEEVVDISDRVIVLKDRKQIKELSGDEISEANVLSSIAEGAL